MATLVRRALAQVADRYGDDRGFAPVWSNLPMGGIDRAYWELVRAFTPFDWGLGLSVYADLAWSNAPGSLSVSVQLGPFSLILSYHTLPLRDRAED
jgi:hypothetical protein